MVFDANGVAHGEGSSFIHFVFGANETTVGNEFPLGAGMFFDGCVDGGLFGATRCINGAV